MPPWTLGHTLGSCSADHQQPLVLFYWAALQPFFAQLEVLPMVVVAQVQDPALALVDLIPLASAHSSSLSDPSVESLYPPAEQQHPYPTWCHLEIY